MKDKLTGLWTRKKLEEHTKENLNIILIDINKLMVINDKFGHIVGDSIIKNVARVIENNTFNDLCVRYGGNLFLIYTEKEKDFGDFIKNKIEEDSFLKEKNISVEFGFESYNPFDSFEVRFENADKKLYEAKSKRSSKKH